MQSAAEPVGGEANAAAAAHKVWQQAQRRAAPGKPGDSGHSGDGTPMDADVAAVSFACILSGVWR